MLFDDEPQEKLKVAKVAGRLVADEPLPKRPIGRPTKYSIAVAEEICKALSTSKLGLAKVAKELGYTPSKVWEWLAANPDFREMYTRAREFQSELLYDDILAIAMMPYTHNGKPVDDGDDPGVPLEGAAAFAESNRRKLIIDSIKWILGRLQARRFGTNYQVPAQVRIGTVTAEQFNQIMEQARKAALPSPAEPGEDTEYIEV